MKFYQIGLRVKDTFHETNILNPQLIIGAESEETALYLAKQRWTDNAYEILKVYLCEEVFPSAVFCDYVYFGSI